MNQKMKDIFGPFVLILLCMVCATMVGIIAASMITGMQGFDTEELMEQIPGLSLMISLGAYLLCIFFLRKSMQFDQGRFGFNRHDWSAVCISAAVLMTAGFSHLWSSLIYLTGIQNIFTMYTGTSIKAFQGQNPVLLIITTVIVGPIAEELIFRFCIYRRVKAYYGMWIGMLISAVLFGVYHANMIQFIYAGGLGILFALLYEKSGDILVPVLAHMAANLWAIIFDYLQTALENVGKSIWPFVAGETAVAAICLVILAWKLKSFYFSHRA